MSKIRLILHDPIRGHFTVVGECEKLVSLLESNRRSGIPVNVIGTELIPDKEVPTSHDETPGA